MGRKCCTKLGDLVSIEITEPKHTHLFAGLEIGTPKSLHSEFNIAKNTEWADLHNYIFKTIHYFICSLWMCHYRHSFRCPSEELHSRRVLASKRTSRRKGFPWDCRRDVTPVIHTGGKLVTASSKHLLI